MSLKLEKLMAKKQKLLSKKKELEQNLEQVENELEAEETAQVKKLLKVNNLSFSELQKLLNDSPKNEEVD